MGCVLPATLIGENESNIAGHWESDEIRELNDQILGIAGCTWRNWAPLSPEFFCSTPIGAMVDVAADALDSEFGKAPLFVLKDPRVSLLAPFWLDVLRQMAIEPAIVCTVRNPVEVARSLARRDGIHESEGQLIWLRHVLEAESSTRGRPRLYTTYDHLLSDWQGLVARVGSTFGIHWPRTAESRRADVGSFLAGSLRHHALEDGEFERNPLTSAWVRDVFRIVSGWADAGESRSDYEQLDAIREVFDESAPVFAAAVNFSQNAMVDGEDLAALQQQLAIVQAEKAEAEFKFTDMQLYAERLQADLATVASEREQALAAAATSAGWQDGEPHGGTTEKEPTSQAEQDAVKLRVETELAEAKAWALELEARCESAEATVATLEGCIAELDSRMRQRDEELAQVWRDLELAQVSVAELSARSASVSELEKKLKESDGWTFRLASDRQSAEAARTRAERALKIAIRAREAAEAARDFQWTAFCEARSELERTRAELHTQRLDFQTSIDLADVVATAKVEVAIEDRDAALARLERAEQEAAAVKASRDAALARLDEAHEELACLSRRLISLEDALQAEQGGSAKKAEESTALLIESRLEADGLRQEVEALRAQIDGALAEASTARTSGAEMRAAIKLQCEIARVQQSAPWWSRFRSSVYLRKRTERVLLRRGLFDSQAYLDRYPDVAASGQPALEHFLRHGIEEGRCPI